MIYIAWKVLRTTQSFSLTGKAYHPKCFISIFFALSSGTSTNPYFPLRRAFLFTLCNFIFIWVSIFSYKAPTKGHYDRTWALDVANMRVCFMNGSMIEHNGLGITCFSINILRRHGCLLICLSIEIFMSKLDYCFESYKSPNVHATKKRKCDEQVRQHSTSKILFLLFTYSRTRRN